MPSCGCGSNLGWSLCRLYTLSVPSPVTGVRTWIWTGSSGLRPHGSLPRMGNTIPTSAKLATSEQVNVRCPFLFSSRQGYSYDLLHCPLYQSLGIPVLPEAADSFFWPSRRDTLVSVSRVKCTGEKFAWVGTTNNPHTTCRQDCVFTVTSFNHGSRQMFFRHLPRCLYTVCGASARVSVQVAVRCLVSRLF